MEKSFLIFLISFCNIVSSQPKTSVKDSLIIENYIKKLNLDEFTENGTQAEFDSLAKYSNDGYRNGNVTYSPDKKFKVFVIEGESCGHCCNPMFKSFIHYNGYKKIKNDELYTINKIIKTSKTDYLIFSSGGEGCGIYYNSTLNVTAITFENHKLIYRNFYFKDKFLSESNITKGSFTITERQGFEYGNDFLLKYDKKTKKIYFQFTKIIDENLTKGKFYKAEFILKNGDYYCAKLISKEVKIQ